MRLRPYIAMLAVLVVAAPAAIAGPAAAGPATGPARPDGIPVEGGLLPAPGRPQQDPEVARRVARGKAAWEALTEQQRQQTLQDLQRVAAPRLQEAIAQQSSMN